MHPHWKLLVVRHSRIQRVTYQSTLHTVQDEWKDRFTLSIEDYLHGLITLVNELVRMLVRPVQKAVSIDCFFLLKVKVGRQRSHPRQFPGAGQNIDLRKRFIRWIYNGSGLLPKYLYPTNTCLKLNLKNDLLRRRFDGLKYDMKKIEEGMV